MPDISVVISSLDGADGVDRCLRSLKRQTIAAAMEVIVVDDGSADDTYDVARAHGVIAIRHGTNRGLSAARNSGILRSTAPVVAFLDDDCEAETDWAELLLAGYRDHGVAGVGGTVIPSAGSGLVGRYLERHNPLEPLEVELSESESLRYRLRLYLRRQWAAPPQPPEGIRVVHSLVGASMSFRRDVLLEVGLFDTRFTFGAEELDVCRRIGLARPGERLLVQSGARVTHHFDPSMRDVVRRSRSYGRGAARMHKKWPAVSRAVYPFPFTVAGLALAGIRWRPALAAAALAPQLLFPSGARGFLSSQDPELLLDAYVQLAQEWATNVGYMKGLREFRAIEPDRQAPDPVAEQPAAVEVAS
jgi:GT2 family glycosyltransferase